MSDDVEGEIEQLREQGYVILRGLLDDGEIARIVAALAPLERERPMGRNAFEGQRSQRVYSLAGKDAAFRDLAEHPRIVRLLDRLLLPNPLLSTLQSIRLHPGEQAQAWHTDDAFYLIPRPRRGLALSTIWAIEAFTDDNGATQLIPGSHRWAGEHPDERPHEVVTATMPAGSVLVFEGALWHRGGANRGTGTRLCLSPQYCQPWLRPQESQLLIAPPAVAATCSPRLRSLLGYSIHPPFLGQVDGMHPLRLVDETYRTGNRRELSEAAQAAEQVLARPASQMERDES